MLPRAFRTPILRRTSAYEILVAFFPLKEWCVKNENLLEHLMVQCVAFPPSPARAALATRHHMECLTRRDLPRDFDRPLNRRHSVPKMRNRSKIGMRGRAVK